MRKIKKPFCMKNYTNDVSQKELFSSWGCVLPDLTVKERCVFKKSFPQEIHWHPQRTPT